MGGATASFDEIYGAFHPRILRYLERLLGPSEADDASQEVFERVSRHLEGFRGDAQLSTWIFRIARNAAWDRLRARAVQRRVTETDVGGSARPDRERADPDEKTPEPDEQLARSEMNACIRELIGDLPDSSRTVLFLSDFQGLRNQEIADKLGVSLAAVKIRLHRARTRLKQELEAHCTFHRDRDRGLACEPLGRTRPDDPEA